MDEKSIDTLPNKLSRTPKNIPIEKILELRNKDLSQQQIADLLGCTKPNITIRLRKYKAELEGLDLFKKHRADVLAVKQRKLLNNFTERDIKEMSPKDRIVSFAILYDKERLERGKSTENISHQGVVEHYNREIDRISKALDDLEGK